MYHRDLFNGMYKSGHTGVALLVYGPLGFGLLVMDRVDVEFAVIGGVVMVLLVMLPDTDELLPFLNHRGATHTIAFSLFVGLFVGIVGVVAAPSFFDESAITLGLFGFMVGTLSILSHLVADSITPMGIKPFWPITSVHYSFNLVPANDPTANYILLSAGLMTFGTLILLAGIF